jgi:hypothetical protein
MRAERVVEEIAKELAAEDDEAWDSLQEDDKAQYRKAARAKAEEIKKRLSDPKRIYPE